MSTDASRLQNIKIPTHIAFIMDGNGRWAKNKGLERSDGHAAGADVAEKMVRACNDIGIQYCTLFAFSTENWKKDHLK